jgi:hypothetical protein
MSYIKKYSRFVEEYVMTGTDTDTETKPDTDTPVRTRPSRPGSLPIETPAEEDAPLAAAKKVMDRFIDIYNQSSEEEKNEIDSYFEK